jgi:FtsP/CotA-like multicopper oxidase with cupredoxin domain
MILSRRRFLQSSSAALSLGYTMTSFPALANTILSDTMPRLTVGTRSLEVNGKAARVFGITQPNGAAGFTVAPGQPFAVELINSLDAATIVHWHGQTPPWEQDGVMDAKRPMLQPQEHHSYDFPARPGTHWMHSHHGLQEQLLLAAPLIVHTAAEVAADAQEIVILLHDFSFQDPAEILAALKRDTSMGGMDMEMGDLSAMTPAALAKHQTMMRGMMGSMAMDVNDIAYDAFLANDRTLHDPQIVKVTSGGTVRLRIINGATTTGFWIDTGAITAHAVAVDGTPIQPVTGHKFGLAMGQRLDLMLTLPKTNHAWPIFAQREGDRQRTGIVLAPTNAKITKLPLLAKSPAPPLDLSFEHKLRATTSLPTRPIDALHQIILTGSMTGYHWEINGKAHGNHTPVKVQRGQRVALEFRNLSMMMHPMHLHGHAFQVVALDDVPVNGAVRDTVIVPVGATVRVVFDADNPGSWPLHCHNLMHMASGMMTEVVYAA